MRSLCVGLIGLLPIAAHAQQLTIQTPSSLSTRGSGQGERAIFANAATVAGVGTVDLVLEVIQATRDHRIQIIGGRPAIRSNGQDDVWLRLSIFAAGTYDFDDATAGVPVVADAFIQINDVDGPNNEEVFAPVCGGDVQFVRIDLDATTGRDFGTVAGRPEIFSLLGDKNYNSQPESGLEISYGPASQFEFGRTANSGFFIIFNNPTYTAFNTFDYECADFVPPVAVDDSETGTTDTPVVLSILDNDSIATANDNGPNNNSQLASEFGRQTISLVPPAGVTPTLDADGDVIGFTIPGEGEWAVDDNTGNVTFTPVPGFFGPATEIDYTFENGLGVSSNVATISVVYPPAPILAQDDVLADPVDAGSTQTGVLDLLVSNGSGPDTLNSVPVTSANVTTVVNSGSSIPQGFTLNSDGTVDVAAGTAPGTYNFDYDLCEIAVPTNCDTATATITVGEPGIGVVKTSAFADDGDSDGFADAGETINYTFTVTNTGDFPLETVSVSEVSFSGAGTLPAPTFSGGDTNGNSQLDLTETWTFTAAYTLAPADITSGTITNLARADGASPNGTPATDQSDSGNAGDGNGIGTPGTGVGNDDPTTTRIVSPALEVLKTAAPALSTPPAVGDTITYTITVENTGNVTLADVTPADTLTDANGGALALTTPVTLTSESITTNGLLDIGETITYTATFDLTQDAIAAGGVSNTAVSTGNPVETDGTDIPGVPDVTDTSDDPTDTTDTVPAGEDGPGDPTVTLLDRVADLRLEKTAVTSLSSPPAVGDTIDYTITVVNTGNVALADVTPVDTPIERDGDVTALTTSVTEDSESVTDNDILDIGETITYLASVALTQDMIDSGGLDNVAISTGNPVDSAGNDIADLDDVSDTADDPADTENEDPNSDGNPGDPTSTDFTRTPALEVTKAAAAAFSTPAQEGDLITYTIAVVNTGNVTLGNLDLDDTFTDANGDPLALTSGPTEVSESETDNDLLEVGETITYTATFELTQSAIEAGGVENAIDVTGTPVSEGGDPIPGLTPVTDTSDDPADTTDTVPSGQTSPGDPTITSIAITPDLRLEKTASAALSTPPAVGDLITYTITVVNTGNVALADITPVDTLTDLNDDPLTLTSGPTEVSESDTDDDILQVGESITFEATFELTQQAITAGGVLNEAVSTGNPVDEDGNDIPGLDDVTDTADDPTNPDNTDPNGDGNPGDPTQTLLTQVPDLRLTKVADTTALSAPPVSGDVITYTIEVVNTGNVPLGDVTPVDTLTDANGDPLALTSGPTEVSESLTDDDILEVGETITYEATFALDTQALDAGGVENSAVSTGNPVDSDGNDIPGLTDVSDTSDDPAETADEDPNGDGNPGDPTVTPLDQNPALQLTKSVAGIRDVNGNGFTDAGDIIDYTFRVENTGNVTLTDVTVDDVLADVSGTAIDLAVGAFDDTTFTATYVVDDDDIAAGGVENTATATGTPPPPAGGGTPTPVSDTSDTGEGSETTNDPDLGEPGDPNGTDDDDGDPTNDPTVALFTPEPRISVIKSVASLVDTNANGLIDEGDRVLYSFTVTNTGNVALAGVTIDDDIVPVDGGPIALGIGATDTATFTADYEITSDDVDAGAVENTATASGNAVDSDGNPINDDDDEQLRAEDTSDAGTAPGLDDTGTPVAIPDPENTETPDAGGATDGEADNDSTVFFIPNPQLSLIKSVGTVLDSNGDGQFGGEDDFITYTFTVRNTGNTDLEGVTIDDPLFSVDGGPIDLAIGAGDSVTFTGQYQVTDDDIDRGYVENSAEATGDATLNGAPVYGPLGTPQQATDTSDSGTDPNAEAIDDPENTETPDGQGNTDGINDNDPTVTNVPANPIPSLSVIKSITDVADTNGSGITDAGDTLTYGFVVTNTGNVALADVAITDPRVGPITGTISLGVGESDDATFSATAIITDAEAAQGYIENTASAEGGAVNGAGNPIRNPDTSEQLIATATSDAGSEPRAAPNSTPDPIADPAGTETVDGIGETNGNLTDDPTVLFLPDPDVSLIKSVVAVLDSNGDGLFGGLDDEITYGFVVTNTGNTPLEGLTINDPTATVSGGPIDLAVGGVDTTSFTATKIVTAADLTQGYVENTAEATGTPLDPTGTPVLDGSGAPVVVLDTSDTGSDRAGDPVFNPEATETPDGQGDTDGDTSNDPTVVSVPAAADPEVSLIKSVADVTDTNGDQVRGNADDVVTYSFDVTNTGNTDLVDVIVNDPLLGGIVGTIANLPIGATESLTATYTLTDDDVTRTFVENSATATGDAVNSSGAPLLDPATGDQLTATDASDTGTDPETANIGNPEGTETSDGDGGTDGNPTNDPTVLIVPLEPSGASVSGIVFLDVNENGVFENGIDTLLAGYVVELTDADGNVIGRATTGPNGSYEIAGFPVSNDNTLTFIDPETGEVIGTIGDLDFIDTPNLSNQNQAVLAEEPADLVLRKTSPVDDVIIGQAVPYEITLTNTGTTAAGNVTITDTLPRGMLFIEGSATVDGGDANPTVQGQTQTFTGINVPGGSSVTIQLSARVLGSAPVGELVNAANALDGSTGERLTPTATATVRRRPEAVFDCTDIIGKVFNDRNMNGYQDGQQQVDRSLITDQDYFVNGKIEKAAPVISTEEPGIPGVRLVTPTGTIITTDEYGRYSVPCAELPSSIGSNFILKLDTRSLPTGFRVTTENPRSMRVTAGIMAEMNFGASIGRVVDVDLTAAAFVPGQIEPVDRLEAGVRNLLAQVADTPSIIRISYYEGGEGNDAARARLDAVEDMIEEQWREIGNYRLIIEKTVKRLQ
ncbi:DUF7507 domain-containing protein [Cognatiyoonia koreensis]|uniref:DUF7507 domain-containing protein n=1 Tax=Cognatiyoonia koreensis TaxID=364200 RepID=UPI0013F4DD18|nr:DUF11 domain-containing protein [Cognatiyoonia koreensis]